MDNSIITKFELSNKEKNIRSNFLNATNKSDQNPSNPNQYQNPFTGSMHIDNPPNLFEQTKSSIDHLIFTRNNQPQHQQQPSSPYEEEENITKLLKPLYDNISQLQHDITRMNQYTKADTNLNPKEVHSIHSEIKANKTKIKQSLDYVDENEEILQDKTVVKAIEDLKLDLITMNKDLMEIQDDFEEKFALIIREQEQRDLAERLMKGELSSDANLFFPNQQVNISKKYLDSSINYEDINNDILDIGFEQMQLYNDYKRKVADLPKLVKPTEKVFFSYQLDDDIMKQSDQKDKGAQGNKYSNVPGGVRGSNNVNGSDDRSHLDTAVTSMNIKSSGESRKMKQSSNSNQQGNKVMGSNNSNRILIHENNAQSSIGEVGKDNEEDDRKRNEMNVIDQMNLYQNKMSSLSSKIQVEHSKLPQPRKVIIGGYPPENELHPRSSKCKKSYQRFKKQKMLPIYEYRPQEKNIRKYKNGIYPNEPIFNRYQYPSEPKSKNSANPYDGIPDDKLRDIIAKIIENNIREKLNNPKGNIPQEKISIEYRNHQHPNAGLDDLIKLLIEKFGDLENAMRDNRGNGQNGNNDIDDLASKITAKIKADMNINVTVDGNVSGYGGNDYRQEERNAGNWNIGHESFALNKQKTHRVTEDNKEDSVNPFDVNRRIDINELDNSIKMPHKINLGDYDVSSASSVMEDSKRNMIDQGNNTREQLNSSNSLSKGQIVTDTEDDAYSNHNNHNQIRNRTAEDLLLAKTMNEHISSHILSTQQQHYNQSQLRKYDNDFNDDADDGDYDDSFPDMNSKEIIDIDNNKQLKFHGLYDSNEYNQFRNNLPKPSHIVNPNFNSSQNQPSSSLKLIRTSQQDIEAIQQKQSMLADRFRQLAMKSDAIHEIPEEQMHKSYRTDESSDMI